MGSKILGCNESNGAHPLEFKEKEKVYLNSSEIGDSMDNFPRCYDADFENSLCHSNKEDFANEEYLMTIYRLFISEKKLRRDFHRFFEIKVIDVILVLVSLTKVNLKNLPNRTLKLLLKSISLTPKVFSALFWHKK